MGRQYPQYQLVSRPILLILAVRQDCLWGVFFCREIVIIMLSVQFVHLSARGRIL